MERNNKEKNMLYEWGLKYQDQNVFQKIDLNKESYFKERQKSVVLTEYGFETFPELVNLLDNMWGEDMVLGQIKRVVGVAALKNKPIDRIQKEVGGAAEEKKENILPSYIYNF